LFRSAWKKTYVPTEASTTMANRNWAETLEMP
jgi:hypothetical protein